jgi:hypothetical protein
MDDHKHALVETIAARLKQWREDHAALFGEIPDRVFCQPAADFEKTYGLTGISQQYNLPEGLSSRDLQSYAMLSWRKEDLTAAEQHERLAGVWRLLASCNPGLDKIAHDPRNTDALYHMIMGVASAYNIDDIRRFTSNSVQAHMAREMEKTPEFIKLAEVFNRHAAPERLNLKWVASPETLRSIQDKIISKYRRDF